MLLCNAVNLLGSAGLLVDISLHDYDKSYIFLVVLKQLGLKIIYEVEFNETVL